MASAGQGRKIPLFAICLVLLGAIHNVLGTGHIEVHFIRYTDSCDEHLGLDKCDPMFSFCLSTPQNARKLSVDNCNYASTGESRDHYQNTNHVDMEFLNSILGHKNPWVVQVNKFIEPRVMLVIKVRDADLIFHDHLQTWGITLTEIIWPNKEQAVWEDRTMSSQGYQMRFKVRMYCDTFYYTSKCDKYCKPEDSTAGHYTCDPSGEKICLPGWKGPTCTEDINECNLGYCGKAECINLPGDFKCICPPNYTGKNCTDLMNPCRSQPCQNGGTCYAHNAEHIYICQCTQEWVGINCENQKNKMDPCQSHPCLNNGSCIISSDKNYTCSCVSPYTGAHCESAVISTTIHTSLEKPSVLTSNTTATIPDSSTIKMTNESNMSTSSESQDANVQHLVQEDDDSGFQPWYIAFIVAAVLIVLIVLAILFIRRRKRKAAQELIKSDVVVSYTGNNLVFENGMYNNANRNNSVLERQTRNLPPVPNNPTDEELFNPTKPGYAEVNETQGATARCKEDSSDLKKNADPNFGLLTRPVSGRAQINPYADFRSLRESHVELRVPDKEDGDYHNLDDITISLEAIHDHNEYNESSDDAFNYDIQETPVVKIQSSPYDIPSNNSSYYDSPKPNLPSPLMPHRCHDLTTNGDDVFVSADDISDSSDDDTLQEDVAQLRKSVEDNLTPYGTPKS